MKVCIDAGHGGTDSGAVGVGNRYEKHDALRMALALRDTMAARGHTVITTRTGDVKPSYADRYNLANGVGADAFVSLHRNSAVSSTANGIEVLYRTITSKSNANNVKSRLLAEELCPRIASAAGFKNRGAKVQNVNTLVLQKTLMPAVTIEAGFVINPADNMRFDSKFSEIINAIADGLEAQFGAGSGKPTVDLTAGEPDESAENKVVQVPVFFANGGVLKLTSPYTAGTNVAWAQNRLARHLSLIGQADGIFGPKTKQSVILFQTARKREGRDIGAIDGIVGRKTAAILAE